VSKHTRDFFRAQHRSRRYQYTEEISADLKLPDDFSQAEHAQLLRKVLAIDDGSTAALVRRAFKKPKPKSEPKPKRKERQNNVQQIDD